MRANTSRCSRASRGARALSWLLTACLLGAAGALHAGPRASENYRVLAEALPLLGGAASSTNYSLQGAAETGGAVLSADYTIVNGFFVTPSAEMVVEVSGSALANGTGKLDLGVAKIGAPGESRTITVRNVGDDDLEITDIGVAGDHAPDFRVDASQTASTVAPGASTAFAVVFKPAAKGARHADVFVTSNDAYAALFTSELLGEGAGIAFQDWKSSRFTAEEIADAAVSGPTADPDGDGVNNFLEYAFGLDPMTPARDGLPVLNTVRVDGADYLSLSFNRLKTSGDLTYVVESSSDLSTWSPLDAAAQTVVDHGDTETVTVRDHVPVGSVAKRFLRVRVIAP